MEQDLARVLRAVLRHADCVPGLDTGPDTIRTRPACSVEEHVLQAEHSAGEHILYQVLRAARSNPVPGAPVPYWDMLPVEDTRPARVLQGFRRLLVFAVCSSAPLDGQGVPARPAARGLVLRRHGFFWAARLRRLRAGLRAALAGTRSVLGRRGFFRAKGSIPHPTVTAAAPAAPSAAGRSAPRRRGRCPSAPGAAACRPSRTGPTAP